MKTYYFDDYGAISNGVIDCTAIWNKIIAEINIANAVIEFGSGVYLFKSNIAMDLNPKKTNNMSQSITIKGQGKGITTLLWDGKSTSGISLSHTDIGRGSCRYNIYDMSLVTKGASNGNAITLTNNSPQIFGGYLSMRGVAITGYGAQASGSVGWACCLLMNAISFNNIIDCDFIGNYESGNSSTGISIYSKQYESNIVYSIVTNITDCIFLRLTAGVINQLHTQGVSISQSNFTNCEYGVSVPDNGYQISVSTSQFDCYNSAVIFDGGTTAFLFSNNLVFTGHNDGYGICCNNYVDGYIITGNQFEGVGTENNVNAIVMNGASPAGTDTNIISSNIFRNYTTAISLAAGTKGWKVFGNMYANTSNMISNQGQGNIISD